MSDRRVREYVECMDSSELLGDVVDSHYCHGEDTRTSVDVGPGTHCPLTERVCTEFVEGRPLKV